MSLRGSVEQMPFFDSVPFLCALIFEIHCCSPPLCSTTLPLTYNHHARDIIQRTVVAGLEPEATNVFLQELGTAATDQSLDFADIVRRTLDGETPGSNASGGGGSKSADPRAADEEKSAGSKEAANDDDEENARRQRQQEEEEAAERRRRRKEKQRQKEEEEERRAREEREARDRDSARNDPAPSSSAGGAGALDVNGDWERTAELVGALISKPSMKQKLLSRPPFRFIADTVLNISKATGFLDGLYSGVSAVARLML